MSCKRYRRRISDDLDGALGPAGKSRLERHFAECAECRAYRAELLALQKRTRAAADPRRPESYWTDFARRLDARLAGEGRPGRTDMPRSLSRAPWPRAPWARTPWAWGAAALLVLAILGGAFLLRRGGAGPDVEAVLLEDPVGGILDAAGSSPAVEGELDRAILASIDEAVHGQGEESILPAGTDPFFWESLNEAELRFIESELRVEQTQGGVL